MEKKSIKQIAKERDFAVVRMEGFHEHRKGWYRVEVEITALTASARRKQFTASGYGCCSNKMQAYERFCAHDVPEMCIARALTFESVSPWDSAYTTVEFVGMKVPGGYSISAWEECQKQRKNHRHKNGKNMKNYDPTKRMTREEAIANPQPVCVLVNEAGKPKGVLVRTLDMSIVVALRDFNGGKEMQWKEAMDALKSGKKRTFTKREGLLLFVYAEALNSALISVGVGKLFGCYWTSTEHCPSHAYVVYFDAPNSFFCDERKLVAVRTVTTFS